jgi:hypothetical protein
MTLEEAQGRVREIIRHGLGKWKDLFARSDEIIRLACQQTHDAAFEAGMREMATCQCGVSMICPECDIAPTEDAGYRRGYLAGLSRAVTIANDKGWDYPGSERNIVLDVRNAITAECHAQKKTAE